LGRPSAVTEEENAQLEVIKNEAKQRLAKKKGILEEMTLQFIALKALMVW
jgi:hypothetical protein